VSGSDASLRQSMMVKDVSFVLFFYVVWTMSSPRAFSLGKKWSKTNRIRLTILAKKMASCCYSLQYTTNLFSTLLSTS
jgi:hypothetical protein